MMRSTTIAGLLVGVALIGGCGDPAPVPPPPEPATGAARNVLLLINDAWRQDTVGAYNAQSKLTPRVDALAKDAVLFETAVAQSSCTINSAPSIYFGVYPSEHGLTDYRRQASDKLESIAELLAGAGFATYTASANPHVGQHTGLRQGFQMAHERRSWRQRAGKVNARFRKWVSKHRDQRFFATLWYVDNHVPYDPPQRFLRKLLSPTERELVNKATKTPSTTGLSAKQRAVSRKLYRGAVKYWDWELGRLIEFLRREGLYEETAIIVTSDHGESFWGTASDGSQTTLGHCSSLLADQIDIPLLIRAPGVAAGRSTFPAQHIDLLPTVLDLAGVEARPDYPLRGESLAPQLLHRGPAPPRPLFTELLIDRYGPHRRRGVRVGNQGLVRTYVDRAETYQPPRSAVVTYGPGPVPARDEESQRDLARDLGRQLDEWLPTLRAKRFPPIRTGKGKQEELDELAEQLEALGYVR